MSGIDRLRTLAGAWDAYGLGGTLEDVARQIERERACDEDTIENIRLIVGGVVDDMERHVSGVEGADDSPVARWARELRRALKSYTSDAAEQQKPSWHDPADAADVTSDAPKVTRDPAEDVSMSAYDLLPQEELEAIAWVRERGGLERVKKLLDWVVDHCSTKQQLDFDFWLSGRVMHELGFDEDMADRDEVERRLRDRLMPEGMEWLVEAWPRFEDDAPVHFGDMALIDGDVDMVEAVQLWIHGRPVIYGDGGSQQLEKGERVKRPAPKVLDADGVEIRVGDTVYHVKDGSEMTVYGIEGEWLVVSVGSRARHDTVTHRVPVLAADGRPLREGETVWKKDGTKLTVMRLVTSAEGLVGCSDGTEAFGQAVIFNFVPFELYHERPESWERIEEDAEKDPCDYFGFDGEETCGKCPASGKGCEQTMARDLVRRARALAERGQ